MKRALLALSIGVVMSFVNGVAQATMVEATFTSDAEGWGVTPDANLQASGWEGAQGNPPGALCGTDHQNGLAWYFSGAEPFLGDLSGFFGGTLSFDLKVTPPQAGYPGPVTEDIPDVAIVGDSQSLLYFGLPQTPDSDWYTYSAELSVFGGWYLVDSSDPGSLRLLTPTTLGVTAATADAMQEVLGGVEHFYIRGEYAHGPDQACLDNVRLTSAVPVADAGGTASLSLLSLIGLGLLRMARGSLQAV